MDSNVFFVTFTITLFLYCECIYDTISNSFHKEYCSFQTFNPSCHAQSVIVVQKAYYGRMKLGICDVTDDGFQGCSRDVTQIINLRCGGRESCSLFLPDTDLEATMPCGQLFSYLEIQYKCQPVILSKNGICGMCAGISLEQPQGFISSFTALKTKCGSSTCPWILTASKGQEIQLKLYDYSYKESESNSDTCEMYAKIEDINNKKITTVCGRKSPEYLITDSMGNLASMSLINPGKANFLIEYEFIGCPDIEKEGFVFSRNDHITTMKCTKSGEEFILNCEVNSWTNINSIYCLDVVPPIDDGKISDQFPISLEYLALLISSVCFLIGSCIIVCGIYAFCRRPIPIISNPNVMYKDMQNYDSMHNQPIRHPGRDFRYLEDVDEDFVLRSFPRMSTNKMSMNKSIQSLQTPVIETPLNFQT